MLLNLSNHPSSKWGEKQLAATEQFGGVIDMAFPNIPPAATEDDVRRLVEVYAGEVLASDAKIVHLMGEMCFSFALVSYLQKIGIPCVASTTERRTVENPDGSKTLSFEFVQFRTVRI